MQVTATVKARVKAKLEESIALAEAHYGTTFKMPTILYTKRGRVAGVANYIQYEVNFNPVLLMENVESFIARTVPHEMAHLIDHKLHPENFQTDIRVDQYGRIKRTKRDIHGRTFKAIMGVLGADNSRCHSYDTTRSAVRQAGKSKHLYTCNTCGSVMKLGPIRHKKMQAGSSRYWMRSCKHHIGYTYQGLEGSLAPLAIASQIPTTPAAHTDGPAKNKSKLQLCRELYDWTKSRQWNINQFVVEAHCTNAGAATYYAKIKKGG